MKNIKTLDELRDYLIAHADDESIDWTELPTFGGDEPDDTSCVWSWDANRLLVGTSESDLKIINR